MSLTGATSAVSSVLDVFEAAALDETGALVRRAWMTRAERDLPAGRGRRPAVLLIDLDHFKRCNDTFGHLAGDHVLAEVVWVIRTELRHVDLIGRYGGDELAVLLAGAVTRRKVAGIAERIRRRVEALNVLLPDESGRPGPASLRWGDLTVSIGAAVPRGGSSPDLPALLAVADTALYAAKNAGRNAVRVAEVRPVSHVPGVPCHGR